MTTCTTCNKDKGEETLYWCYECSRRVCHDCVRFVDTGQGAKASVCQRCYIDPDNGRS